MNLNAEYHRSLAQAREEVNKSFTEEPPEPQPGGWKRLDEREKKEL